MVTIISVIINHDIWIKYTISLSGGTLITHITDNDIHITMTLTLIYMQESFHFMHDDDDGASHHENKNNTVIMIQPLLLMMPPLAEQSLKLGLTILV